MASTLHTVEKSIRNPTSLVVTTSADNTSADGACSLREAITNANADAQPYTIITGDPTSADTVYEVLTAAGVADISVTNQDNDSLVIADDDVYATNEDQTLTLDAANGVLNGDTGGKVMSTATFSLNYLTPAEFEALPC